MRKKKFGDQKKTAKFYISHIRRKYHKYQTISTSLGGDGPRYEIVVDEDESSRHSNTSELHYQRARVLCSYDAKDSSELNLIANEVRVLQSLLSWTHLILSSSPQVIFVADANNPDYMHGKQGLLKGLVPKAFLEILDD